MAKIVVLLIVLFAVGCSDEPDPKYVVGDLVRTKVGHFQGQILYVSRGGRSVPSYQVRLSVSGSEAESHILGSGGPIEQHYLTTEWLKEYELETFAEVGR